MHLIDNLVPPVHREVDVDVRFQAESSQMMERDGEPLQRIVEMWKRAVSFLSLFETPNLPVVPLELLLREPRHSVLPLQRVNLQVKVEILFRLNIFFQYNSHALHTSSRPFSSPKFTNEFQFDNFVDNFLSIIILLHEIAEFKKEKKRDNFTVNVTANDLAIIDIYADI